MALATRNPRTDTRTGSSTGTNPAADLERMLLQLTGFPDGWTEMGLRPDDAAFIPLADIEETDDAYLVELDLPGVKKEDIDLTMSGRRLMVTGERKEKERTGLLRRRTRTVGRFNFEVVLPEGIDAESVEAHVDDGVLTIRVPKATLNPSRHIEVT